MERFTKYIELLAALIGFIKGAIDLLDWLKTCTF